MTTIATDGRTVAADSLVTGDFRDKTVKLFRLKDGGVAAGAGQLTAIHKWVAWLEGEYRDAPDFKDGVSFEGIVAYRGVAYYFDNILHPVPVDAPTAIGSGAVAALTAMRSGMSARKAVEAAKKIDVYTGGKVRTLKTRRHPKKAMNKKWVSR